ncbi:HPP family protein [Spirillospora sp. NPDC127200]
MLVREAMTSPVVTLAHTASVRQAIGVLHRNDITAVPVVDEKGELVGIVSEMDLLRGEFEADPRAFVLPPRATAAPPRSVAEVMTAEVRTTRPAADVAEFMIRTGVKSVPVLDGRRLVGMLSRRDLLGVLARDDARIRTDVLAAIADLLPGEAHWTVAVTDGVVTCATAPTEPRRSPTSSPAPCRASSGCGWTTIPGRRTGVRAALRAGLSHGQGPGPSGRST